MKDRSSLFTIGHSTHPIETFVGLLAAHTVATLIDVRSYPYRADGRSLTKLIFKHRLSARALPINGPKISAAGVIPNAPTRPTPHGIIRRFAPTPITPKPPTSPTAYSN